MLNWVPPVTTAVLPDREKSSEVGVGALMGADGTAQRRVRDATPCPADRGCGQEWAGAAGTTAVNPVTEGSDSLMAEKVTDPPGRGCA